MYLVVECSVGRRAMQPNPDLGICGVDRVGCLFGAFGPTQAWRLYSLLGAAYLRNSDKSCPLLRGG